MKEDDIAERHYSQMEVKREILQYTRGRWVAVHCSEKSEDGKPYLIRYTMRGERPLKISRLTEIDGILKRFRRLKPRTFYATSNVYRKLAIKEDVMDLNNVMACTPVWDIDNELEGWESTIEVAKEIVRFLELNGIEESVYVKWSGRGCHVHLHEEAVSRRLREKIHPIDIAYAVVEYVNVKLARKYFEIAEKSSYSLRVENNIDPQRLYTCPLSLHKTLDRVCVCVRKEDLDSFDPSWTDVNKYRHFQEWNLYVPGEADGLALKAFQAVGPCPSRLRFRRRKHPPLDKQILRWLKKT
ncbi:hypothetical protein CP083_03465 [Candidatus Bathyarchaeota archaeon B24-2]|nr:MAG: hypothetical protein CP083_03465 [Candidatus Bathyarchaeota archaeon B24-2]